MLGRGTSETSERMIVGAVERGRNRECLGGFTADEKVAIACGLIGISCVKVV